MIIIPVGHDQTVRTFPWLTAVLIALCLMVQVHASTRHNPYEEVERISRDARERVQTLRDQHILPSEDDAELRALADELEQIRLRDPVYRYGYRPDHPWSINIVLCAFIHGGWLHLIGNLLFLFMVGCNLEDRWGRWRFGVFYLLGAVVASGTYALTHAGEHVPLVGASGAIAAAMGAFLVYFHRTTIRFWYLFVLFVLFKRGSFEIRALYVLPIWFIQQVLAYRLELSGEGEGVAYSAHVGGFVFGLLAAVVLRRLGVGKEPGEEEAPQPLPVGEKARAGGFDAEYLAAMELVDAGKTMSAFIRMQAILDGNPRHPRARRQLVLLAIELDDASTVRDNLSLTLRQLVRQNAVADAVDLYRTAVGRWPTLRPPEELSGLFAGVETGVEMPPDPPPLLPALVPQAAPPSPRGNPFAPPPGDDEVALELDLPDPPKRSR
jgi:membrane associated rhomboid family serine protease